MENILSFVTKFTDVTRSHLNETKEILGKEIVDSTASKIGICVDKIKTAFGAKFSMLGYTYSPEELKKAETINEDVIVCQGNKGRFFVPNSEIVAVGGSVLLIRPNLGLPELDSSLERKREEVFRKFFSTKESIKKLLPKVENPKVVRQKKKSIMRLFH